MATPEPQELLRGIPPVKSPNRRVVKLDKNQGCLVPTSLAFTEGAEDGSSVYSHCILLASGDPWIDVVDDPNQEGIVGVTLDELPDTTFHSHDPQEEVGVEFAHCLLHGASKFPSLSKSEARRVAKAARWCRFPASMEESLRRQGILTPEYRLRADGRRAEAERAN